MRNRYLGLILAVMAALAIKPVILAQTAAQSGAAKTIPELSGVWDLVREPGASGRRFSLEEPPLQPWAMEIYKRNRAGLAPTEKGLEGLDPLTWCFPPGPTRVMLNFPFAIIQVPNKVVMLFEVSDGVRQIYMDGRGHPEGWIFGWMGHSIGKWDGDTLVVDTVGLNDKTWLDNGGIPHSEALHVVERFHRVDHDILEVEFTFEDPKAFTKSWGAKKVYRLRPKQEILERITCEDHLQIGDSESWLSDVYK